MHKGTKTDRLKRASRDSGSTKLLFRTSNGTQLSEEKSKTKSGHRTSAPIIPSPNDFDNFLPWVCRQWTVPCNLQVIRPFQEEHSKLLEDINEETENKSSLMCLLSSTETSDEELRNLVVIEARYDAQNRLEEISFLKNSTDIPKKVIRAINLCVPFHSKLTRINIRNGNLTHSALGEITKMLPHSNITALCLDDSVIPQGRYQMLVQDTCQLSYLSLNRCRINDDVCKEIANNLAFGKGSSNSLHVLELASNNITNMGAQYLGKMLRTNRHILHLNLAGNKITDHGGKALTTALMEFSLTCNEVLEMKAKRFQNLKKSIIIDTLKTCSDQSKTIHDGSETSLPSPYTSINYASKLMSPRSRTTQEPTKMVSGSLVDASSDPYNISNLEIRKGRYFAKGNFVLCSLNVAYNALKYPFLKKLEEVLAYQHIAQNIRPGTGLIRIVLDGNHIPSQCNELNRIEAYLKRNIDRQQPKPNAKPPSPATSKKSHYGIRRKRK